MDIAQQIYQEYIFKSRHARWRDDLGRREEWSESVDRYLDYMFNQAEKCGWSLSKEERSEIRDVMISRKAVGSMRAMMTAGPALDTDPLASYNCTAMAIDHVRAFDEACYLLMLGCGVGLSVERQFIANLPHLPQMLRSVDTVIQVADSKIGWATAIRKVVAHLYAGEIPSWDLSRVRPAGSRIKKFGGRSAGPDPLNRMLTFIVDTFKNAVINRRDNRLNSLDCLDIFCNIADGIVSGGTRRSALMMLSNLSDDRIRQAKSGDWHDLTPWRRMVNISAAYTEKPSMDQFMQEWHSLYASHSGERGIFNRQAAQVQAIRGGKRKESDWLLNPCVSKYTWVHTSYGPMMVKDLIGVPFKAVVDGVEYESKKGFWSNGIKPVFKLVTKEGYELPPVTADHQIGRMDADGKNGTWTKLEKIRPGDKVVLHNHGVYTWGETCPKNIPFTEWVTPYVENYQYDNADCYTDLERESASVYCAFLRNVLNEHGTSHELNNEHTYHSVVGNYKQLTLLQRMFLRLGVYSTIKKGSVKTNTQSLLIIDHANMSIFYTKAMEVMPIEQTPELGISKADIERVFTATVETVFPVGKEEVFDCTVEDVHYFDGNGFYVHNCGETILSYPHGGCNLTEAIIYHNSTVADIAKAVKVATILGTIQATLTSSRYLRESWQKTLEEEALLGVSLTGIMDNPFFNGSMGKDVLIAALNQLRQLVIDTNKECAKKLGINPAQATCLVKPSGTVSKEAGVAAGIHPRLYKKYIGNVIGTLNEPITRFLKDQGIPWEHSYYKPDHEIVFRFPIESPKGVKSMDDVTALDQLELVKLYRQHWCDGHNVSCTIQLGDAEWFDAAGWIYRNWDDVCGLAFLPRGRWPQAPYEDVEDRVWNETVAKFPVKVNWDKLAEYENDDNTLGAQQRECDGPACALR